MSAQERIESANRIISEFRDLFGSDVNSLCQEANVHPVDDIVSTLKTLEDQGRVLQVGIIGRVKAGKSSLLNALFFGGANILPHAATPMTAALTTLTYGEQPAMRAEFFSADDLETFHRLHDDHEKVIDAKEKILAEKARQGSHGTGYGDGQSRHEQPQSASRYRDLAKKEAAKEDAVRASGWELWRDVQSAGGIGGRPNEERIECKNIDELRGQLADYVGARGKHTPFTKCLHLELPLETLRNLCVVDTPGLNDPIVSRENRTRSMLRECDAVFIVSPAGQFLSQQDEDLMERLATREGVRSFYVIASQFDTQLFGYEYQANDGDLSKVIQVQQASLARHAKNVLSSWSKSHSALAALADESEQRLRISSSVAHTLLQRNQDTADETVQFVRDQLRTKYPDYFIDDAASQHWLKALSGIPQLEADLADVLGNKQQIFKNRIDDYLTGQEGASRAWVQLLIAHAETRKREFESTDLSITEVKLQKLAEISQKGSNGANEVFSGQIEDRRLSIAQEIKRIVKEAFKEVSGEADAAKGTTTERREKSGVCSGIARILWGGGYENVSVETVNTKKVRDAVNEFRGLLDGDLNDYVNRKNVSWRNEIARSITARLRDEIGDEFVNSDDVRRIGKSILLKISDLPGPQLPVLPDGLAATGTLKGWQKDRFMESAGKYMEALQAAGNNFALQVGDKMKSIQNVPLGSQIFRDLNEETENLKLQLQNKRLTAERYALLFRGLKEIAP